MSLAKIFQEKASALFGSKFNRHENQSYIDDMVGDWVDKYVEARIESMGDLSQVDFLDSLEEILLDDRVKESITKTFNNSSDEELGKVIRSHITNLYVEMYTNEAKQLIRNA